MARRWLAVRGQHEQREAIRGTHVDVGSYGAVEIAKTYSHGERDATLVRAFDVACDPCSGGQLAHDLTDAA